MFNRYRDELSATMDFSLISGGGKNSAFGSGFLVGWSIVTDKQGSICILTVCPACLNVVASAKKVVAENNAESMTTIVLASVAIQGMFRREN